MSWQDNVGRQIAAEHLARSLVAAARGVPLRGPHEGPSLLLDAEEPPRAALRPAPRETPRALLGGRAGQGFESEEATVARFAMEMTEVFRAMGLSVSREAVMRALLVLARERWDIDVRPTA